MTIKKMHEINKKTIARFVTINSQNISIFNIRFISFHDRVQRLMNNLQKSKSTMSMSTTFDFTSIKKISLTKNVNVKTSFERSFRFCHDCENSHYDNDFICLENIKKTKKRKIYLNEMKQKKNENNELILNEIDMKIMLIFEMFEKNQKKNQIVDR